MRNWRSSIRSPYAVALLVMGFAAWVALSQLPEDNPRTTTTAAVMDAKTQKRPDLMRAAELILAKTNEFRQEHALEPVEINAQLAQAASYFANYMAGPQTSRSSCPAKRSPSAAHSVQKTVTTSSSRVRRMN